jgi:hypothetical protein
MLHVHEAVDRPYKCEACGRGYKEARNLREHVSINHKSSRELTLYICRYNCGHTTARKRSLLLHYKRCKKKPREDESGPDPENQAEVSANPETEQRGAESDDSTAKTYACLWNCGRSFKSKNYMQKHSQDHCALRKNAPIKVRRHKLAKQNEKAAQLTTNTSSGEGILEEYLAAVNTSAVSAEADLAAEILEREDQQEVGPGQLELEQGPVEIYIEPVPVEEEYIETETISYDDVMELDTFS